MRGHVAAMLFKVEAVVRMHAWARGSNAVQHVIIFRSCLLQVKPMRMKDIDSSSGVHQERRKSVRSRPAAQRKRLFANSEKAPVVEEKNPMFQMPSRNCETSHNTLEFSHRH